MKTNHPVAYSYIRFSHPDQAKGDSLRRQMDAAAAWCERHKVKLDTATTFRDLGKSAYLGDHRKNPERHALAGFLKMVEDGKVPRGSFLVIENLDRLSREHIQPAVILALNLLQAGVRIVQLKPSEIVFDDKSDMMPIMQMMMELSRGHSESAIKSERVGDAWAKKRARARNGEKHILTRRLPAWVKLVDGKPELIEAHAAAVRRIYQLASDGYGLTAIIRALIADKVQPFGASGRWARSYVGLLLRDRRALGEFQPCRRDGTPDGAVIPGYFPAVVSEEQWYAARAGAAERKKKAGRVGKHINIFSGLIHNARDGDSYIAVTRVDGQKSHRVLLNSRSMNGDGQCYSFPLETFERAILSMLAEVDPRDVLGKAGPDESLKISGELATVEAKIAELEVELLKGDVAALAKVLRQLEDHKRELVGKLAEARQKAASPISEAWGAAQSLLTTLDAAPDQEEARLRLRSALRRMISEIRLLVVPRGRDRLAAVQVRFADGKRTREYVILHRPPKANASGRQEGQWWARSMATKVKGLDFRKAADVRRLERVLANLEID